MNCTPKWIEGLFVRIGDCGSENRNLITNNLGNTDIRDPTEGNLLRSFVVWWILRKDWLFLRWRWWYEGGKVKVLLVAQARKGAHPGRGDWLMPKGRIRVGRASMPLSGRISWLCFILDLSCILQWQNQSVLSQACKAASSEREGDDEVGWLMPKGRVIICTAPLLHYPPHNLSSHPSYSQS